MPHPTPQPYHCRLKYLWRGLLDATRTQLHKQQLRAASRRTHPVARLLAPFILLLAIGPLVGALGRPLVTFVRAVGTGPLGESLGNTALVALLLVPGALALKAWQIAKRLCHRGWELEQALCAA